jgi:putative transposase
MHAHHRTAGAGDLDQGRLKSFPVQSDEHFLTVCRYVERNALRANLVGHAEDWRWGSLGVPRTKDDADRPALTPWPIDRPRDWTDRVNRPFGPKEEEAVRRSIQRGQPYGSPSWQAAVAKRLGLESVFRPRGRPRKEPQNGSWSIFASDPFFCLAQKLTCTSASQQVESGIDSCGPFAVESMCDMRSGKAMRTSGS